MSAFVPEAEYRRIKESWRQSGRLPEKWTDRQHFEACHANIVEAAKRERDLRELFNSLSPGDPRLTGDAETDPLALQIRTAVLDQRHWKEYLDHYRRKLGTPSSVLPREPGDDDMPF